MSILAADFSGQIPSEFPHTFLEEVERSNRDKLPDAPVAHVFFARDCDHHLLYCAASQFQILSLAKVYHIALQVISDKKEIKLGIHQTKLFTGRSIQLLIFNAHGCKTGMHLGENNDYWDGDVNSLDYEDLSPQAEIFLNSCYTGMGLAQKIADITKLIVFAPQQDCIAEDTCFSFCQKHGLMEMRFYRGSQGRSWKFQYGQQPVVCEWKKSEDISYFSALKKHVIVQVQSGDAYAQEILGELLTREGNRSEAKEWFYQAANQGEPFAQNCLGECCLRAGHWREAKDWFQKAADQGVLDAQSHLDFLNATLRMYRIFTRVVVPYLAAVAIIALWTHRRNIFPLS